MSNAFECRALVERAAEKFGSVDILVNNAGIQHVAPVDQFPVGKRDAILAINLSSAFHTIQHALPAMRKNGFGRIVNIASAHGLVASPFKSAYVAAKHGILGLTKTVALELAEHGITVNAIAPGEIATPMTGQHHSDPHDEDRKWSPAGRPGHAREIGEWIAFLASPASGFATGASVVVDGGLTLMAAELSS